jgi:hypothetical protein
VRRGIGIGLIVVLLALAIVLVLSARRSAQVVEAAGEALTTTTSGTEGSEAAPLPGAGQLPGLDEMKRSTGRHTDEVRRALEGDDDDQ